jgi:hypothetical protein
VGGRGAERPSAGPVPGPGAVPPPSRMRAREATPSPSRAGGEQLLPRCGGRRIAGQPCGSRHGWPFGSGSNSSGGHPGNGIADAVMPDRRRGRGGSAGGSSRGPAGGAGTADPIPGVACGFATSREFSRPPAGSSRDFLSRATATATEVTIASRTLRASYARCTQLREQYRRGLLPSDGGTGFFWQCSHSRRPSSSRGTSYFVMPPTVAAGACTKCRRLPGRRRRVRHRRPPYVSKMTYSDEHQDHGDEWLPGRSGGGPTAGNAGAWRLPAPGVRLGS